MFPALILSISAVIDRAIFYRFIFKFFGCIGLRCGMWGFLWLPRAGATLLDGVRASFVVEHGL